MNTIMENASNDAFIDETSWAFSGFGGPCCNWNMGKPGVNKGGQMVMLYDVGQNYPHSYFHWHSQVKKDPCFTTQGANEVYKLIQRFGLILKLLPLPANEEGEADNIAKMLPTNEPANKQQLHPNMNTTSIHYETRKIYNKNPHITVGNHFSGNAITNYLGENGFGYTCTT